MFKYNNSNRIFMTLTPEGYLSRLVETELKVGLNAAGAISIEGPKSCGKTWCARSLAESEYSLVDPNGGFMNRKMADIEPVTALDGKEPHLIDEWQEVPEIWDAVRFTVDKSNQCGRFILCGSTSVNKSKIRHSGSGRILSIRMHPMSLFESGNSTGDVSLRGLFGGEFKNSAGEPRSLDELIQFTIHGGWPNNLENNEEESLKTLKDMINKICEVDSQKVDGKTRNVNKLKKTIKSLARNESTITAKSKIASDIREFDNETVEEETVSEYLDVFKKLYLIEDQPAYSPNYRSSVRVGKNPKRHFTDPSLAVAALNLNSESLKQDLNTFGFMFESLCERDLRIYAQTFGGELYHYRDHSGREIDAVVEIPGKGWGAFEIKLGSNQTDSAAENLKSIDRFIRNDGKATPPQFLCVISGTEGYAYRRPDGVYVVPICMLGP